jgi:hypothetical protein
MIVYDIAAKLPAIDVLRNRCQALAVLECVIGGGESYYTYTREWGADEAALMRNGSGDEWAVVFTADGAFIRVFDHESMMSPCRAPDHELWPGLLDGMPAVFGAHVEEPAFCDEDGQFLATAVLWRLRGDDRWQAGEGIAFPPQRGRYDSGPDGSGMLDILLDDIADRYVASPRTTTRCRWIGLRSCNSSGRFRSRMPWSEPSIRRRLSRTYALTSPRSDTRSRSSDRIAA